MEFQTIAIIDTELPTYKVRKAKAYQYTDYYTKQIKIIAPMNKADQARAELFPCFELVHIWDKYYLITANGKTEITYYEYNDLKNQLAKRYE